MCSFDSADQWHFTKKPGETGEYIYPAGQPNVCFSLFNAGVNSSWKLLWGFLPGFLPGEWCWVQEAARQSEQPLVAVSPGLHASSSLRQAELWLDVS